MCIPKPKAWLANGDFGGSWYAEICSAVRDFTGAYIVVICENDTGKDENHTGKSMEARCKHKQSNAASG